MRLVSKRRSQRGLSGWFASLEEAHWSRKMALKVVVVVEIDDQNTVTDGSYGGTEVGGGLDR